METCSGGGKTWTARLQTRSCTTNSDTGGELVATAPIRGRQLPSPLGAGTDSRHGQRIRHQCQQFYNDWYWYVAGLGARFIYSAGQALPYLVAGIGFIGANPLLAEMTPGSTFLQNLNSSSNISREAGALTRRVGIASQTPNVYGGVWRAVAPGQASSLTAAQYTAGVLFFDAFEYYVNYWDDYDQYAWDKRAGAYLWLDAAAATFQMDQTWCFMIGTLNSNGTCQRSDAVVPLANQVYPGGTRQLYIQGPAHTQETSSNQVHDAALDVLQNDFALARCASTVSQISLTGAPGTLLVGSSTQIRASAANPCGDAVGGVSWQSSDPAVVGVSSSGYVTAYNPGTAIVTASAGGRSADATITVASGSGGGGALSAVGIDGPSVVTKGEDNAWTALPYGGTAPFQYTWSVNGNVWQQGSSDVFTYATVTVFTLKVVVTDATGATTTSTLRVTTQ